MILTARSYKETGLPAPPYTAKPQDQTWIRAGIDYAKRTGF